MATDNQALLLQVSADIRGLEKQFAKANGIVDKGSRSMERRAQQSATSLERFFGKTDPGKALDKVFDSTRFKILDTGVARVGLFGSAFESLGIAGLAAAAGIGAATAAFAQSERAASYAKELADTANKLHLTTDQLQEYRYAIRAAGGDEKDAGGALETFSSILGKAQAGLKRSKLPFRELGFSDEQIKNFKSVDEALVAVTAKISSLKNSPQKDAVVDQLGLNGLKQLVEGGADAMQHLRQEAHAAGLVMDADVIKRGADAQEKYETLARAIDIQLKTAFVDLAPTLNDTLKLALEIASAFADVIDNFKQIENRRTTKLQKERQDTVEQINRLETDSIQGRLSGAGETVLRDAVRRRDRIDAELASRAADNKPPPISNGGGTSLIDQSASSDKAAQQLKHFNDMMARDAEAILATMDNERHSAEERADVARQRLDAEEAARKQELADAVATKSLTAKQAALLSSKDKEVYSAKRRELDAQLAADIEAAHLKAAQDLSNSTVSLLRSQASLAKTAEARAALEAQALAEEQRQAREDLANKLKNDPNKSPAQKTTEMQNLVGQQTNQTAAADAQAADRIAQQGLDLKTADLDSLRDMLDAQLAIARTAAARRDLELKLLDVADARLKAELEGVLASQTATDAEKQIAQKKLDELNASRPAREQNVIRQTNGPLADYIDKLPKSLDDVNERMQSLAVEGLDGLTNAIVDLATGTGDARDLLHNFILRMLADFTKLELQRLEGQAFAGAGNGSGVSFARAGLNFVAGLFGKADLRTTVSQMIAANPNAFADGGKISGPGGPRGDKIPIWASDGEFMVNAEATKKHRALLEAINGGRPLPRYANGGIVNLTNLRLGGGAGAGNVSYGDTHTNIAVSITAAEPHRIDARKTANQIATELQHRMALARRKGL